MKREKVKDNDSNLISCGEHGEQYGRILCRHLLENRGYGFFTPDLKDDGKVEAWCSECELVLREQGEWNEAAVEFANFGLICADCRAKAKKQSQAVIKH